MEAWLVLLALVPLALLVLLIANISKLNNLSSELKLLREQLDRLTRQLSSGAGPVSSGEQAPVKEHVVVAPPPPPVRVPDTVPVPVPEPLPLEQFVRVRTEERTAPVEVVAAPPRVPPPPPKPPRPSFLERNPDLEKFIGENLINKIGIAILVIGLGLLLRYAIGKNMISETGRTLIGIGCGALLIFFAHRLREKFRAFSSVLVGGGLAVLYSTIAIAFQQYHIIGRTPAFLVMVGITAIGVLLTLVYDRRELAIIALLGGFASPFLASRGEGNYIVLFTYLLVLDAGMLVLANYKRWHIINIISFVLTALIFGTWQGTSFMDMEPRPVWPAFFFATAFFLVFFAMNLRYNLKHGTTFAALDFSLLLANTAVYFAGGLSALQGVRPSLDGLFTILLALFHLVFAWWFFKRTSTPKHLVYLLIGLVLTFLSLAGPIQLEGSHITLFWSAEMVLLLWFSQRTGIRLVERASLLLIVLTAISLMMDLGAHYGAVPLVRMTPLMNKPWITGMVSAAAFAVYGALCRRLPQDREVINGISPGVLRNAAFVLCALVFYLVNFLEIDHQLGYAYSAAVVRMALMGYSLAVLIALNVVTRQAHVGIRSTLLLLFAVALMFHITRFYSDSMDTLMELRTGTGGAGFLAFHLLAFAGAVLALVMVAMAVRKLIARPSSTWNLYLWGMCAFLVVFCSQELDHALLAMVHPRLLTESDAGWYENMDAIWAYWSALDSARKGAYPILWGASSFVLMWYGMRTRQRMVRIIALSLFGLTLLKLFLYDIRGVSEGGKVAAFICLGVLLLVVSFMYNKLKDLLKDDGAAAKSPMPPPPPSAPRS